MRKVLFVCLGNICRSPLAEGFFNHHVSKSVHAGKALADSAGTSNWHVGEAPHTGSIRVAAAQGVNLATQKCRQVTHSDFDAFDLILGMDKDNVRNLNAMCPTGRSYQNKISLFLDYAGLGERDVPDPWGKSERDYESAANLISGAVPAILSRLMQISD